MIIAPDILRWLTVKALRGRTWAKGRVYDSPATPADLRIESEREPFIAVYTDDADIELEDEGNSLASGRCVVKLLIEVAVANPPSQEANTGQDLDPSDADRDVAPTVGTTITETDEGLELAIGLISRQAMQALLSTDNPWAELWRLLAPGRQRVRIRRGGPGQEQRENETPSVRFASRIMEIELVVLNEPVFGTPLNQTGVFEDIVVAFEGDAELSGIGALLRGHFEGRPGGPLPSWRIEQAFMNISQEAVTSLRIAPLPVVQADETEAAMGTRTTNVPDDAGPTLVVEPEPDA